MKRTLLLALAAAWAAGCASPPDAATCSTNAQCPANAICVSGLCQKGVPSGGAAGPVGGAQRLTAGNLTLDAVVGEAVTPRGTAGNVTLKPAQNTR